MINYRQNKIIIYDFIAPFSQRSPQISIGIYSNPKYASEKCNNNNLTLLIFINSIPHDFQLRQTIRETWAMRRRNYEIVFIIGENKNILHNFIQTFLLSFEQYRNGDLLLTNIVENFFNLPLKTFTTLYWSSKFCPSAPCLLKTDSDVLIFPKNMLNLCRIRTSKPLNYAKIYGHCWQNALVHTY